MAKARPSWSRIWSCSHVATSHGPQGQGQSPGSVFTQGYCCAYWKATSSGSQDDGSVLTFVPWSRHTFGPLASTHSPLLPVTVSNYATSLPRPLARMCICGIIVSGRTCILMEMDSTAINISKYIYNGFAWARILSCVCVCKDVLFLREGGAAVQDIRGLSCRRCNGLIIRWAGSLWPLSLLHNPALIVAVSKKNGSFNLNANTFDSGLAS